jgi:hypothetical protein
MLTPHLAVPSSLVEGISARHRPGLLRQSSPGVPSDVMVCRRVLAHWEGGLYALAR